MATFSAMQTKTSRGMSSPRRRGFEGKGLKLSVRGVVGCLILVVVFISSSQFVPDENIKPNKVK